MPLFSKTKQQAQIMHDLIMIVPDQFFIGPTLEWKKEYKKTIKDIRRGKTSTLQKAEDYALEKTVGNEELRAKVVALQQFAQDVITAKEDAEERLKPLLTAIKYYMATKAALVMAAEVTQKINEFAAVTPTPTIPPLPNPLGPVQKAIAGFQDKTKLEGQDEYNILHGYIMDWEKYEKMIFQRYIMSWLQPIVDALNNFRDAQQRRADRAAKWVGGVPGEIAGRASEIAAEVIVADIQASVEASLDNGEEMTDEEGDAMNEDTETTGSNYP